MTSIVFKTIARLVKERLNTLQTDKPDFNSIQDHREISKGETKHTLGNEQPDT